MHQERLGTSSVHKILTSPYYVNGEYIWGGTESRAGEANAPSERGTTRIPPIISFDRFEAVQERLEYNNRRNTPPRVANKPSLLISLPRCGKCGSSMRRSGTVQNDRRYSYYSCSGAHRLGTLACSGRHMRVEKVDDLVLDALATRLFTPERLKILLTSLAERQARTAQDSQHRLVALRSAVDEPRLRLSRRYHSIEDGVADEDDILEGRIRQLKHELANGQADLDNAKRQVMPNVVIDAERIARFGVIKKDRLVSADTNTRRRYICSVVQKIELHDDRIRIVEPRRPLRKPLQPTQAAKMLLIFESKWRTREDSNLCIRPSMFDARKCNC